MVLILADDLGSGDLQCYNKQSEIPTPNMDMLAQQGVRFTDAHTNSAVCTPTRYGIITGRYAWRTRLKRGVLNGYSQHLIDPNRTTIASLLKSNGYTTAGVGKWHLGMDFAKDAEGKTDYAGKIENSPIVNGFDSYYGISASLDFPPYVYIEDDHFTKVPTEKQKKQYFPRYLRDGDKADNFDFERAGHHLLSKALGVIDKYANQEKPFFMYYALPSPHKPVWPAKEFQGKSTKGPYGDYVMQTDYIVGQVLKQLKDKGIDDNTLVLFTSDNGSFMHKLENGETDDHLSDNTIQGFFPQSHTANYVYRGTKADVWEGGHRVPFLVRWPAKVKQRVVSETICTTDFFSTFAELVGKQVTANEGEDSFSFLPLLMGNDAQFEKHPVVHHSSGGTFALREGDWKMVFGSGSGGRQKPKGKAWEKPFKLFNMKSDISETTNVIDQNADIAEKMEQKMHQIIEAGTSR
ncbi:Cerebroside-sulfatase [Puteibacter caeruleilacunae]|nr:Cerebroside-sulfatase [Puteibacter caeruleilacunae]